MVIFMLLERRDLRDRLIGLIGHGQLATTTKAFDEAGSRVSRQLLMQSLVSLLYGIAVFIGRIRGESQDRSGEVAVRDLRFTLGGDYRAMDIDVAGTGTAPAPAGVAKWQTRRT